MTNPQQRPRKRSSAIALTGLMAGAAISISACEQPQSGQTWADRDPKSDTTVEASAFNSVADCNAAGTFTAEQCNTAFTQAQAESARNAPQFADQQSCEERFGVAQCVPRTSQDGGSVFTPLLTGFIVGQALSNLGGPRGVHVYHRDDGAFLVQRQLAPQGLGIGDLARQFGEVHLQHTQHIVDARQRHVGLGKDALDA